MASATGPGRHATTGDQDEVDTNSNHFHSQVNDLSNSQLLDQAESHGSKRLTTSVQPQRPKNHHHQKQHTVGGAGRLHTRVPSSKALYRHHASSSKLNTGQRQQSPPSPRQEDARGTGALDTAYRRAHSEVKLVGETSGAGVKRNKSHHDFARRRNRSSDKLKSEHQGPKAQVQFELGVAEAPPDDWVDGSLSTYSSPEQAREAKSGGNSSGLVADGAMPSPHRETTQRKEYLTSLVLAHTLSHGSGAPPKMSLETTSVGPGPTSPGSGSRDSSTAPGTPPSLGAVADPSPGPGSSSGGRDELTSRFITGPSPGIVSEASFYQNGRVADVSRSADDDRWPRERPSSTHLRVPTPSAEESDKGGEVQQSSQPTAPPPADISRTQQKLNLQRASSVIDPGQASGPVAGIVDALVDVSTPGYDGGSSRDPRVVKILERTGMEYLVVRRYQNPVARSIGRLKHLSGADRVKRIPTGNTPGTRDQGRVASSKVDKPVVGPLHPSPLHHRSQSRAHAVQDVRRPHTPQRGQLTGMGTASSLETEDGTPKMNNGVGRFILGHDEEHRDGMATALRNLWQKSMDLSASQD